MHRIWTTTAIAVFAIAGAGVAADQAGRDQSTGATRAERSSSDRSDTREFINTMAIAGMAEVQLGKLAAERAQDPDVKAFAQMMVRDHTEANDELKQASPAGVQLPTQLDEKHRELADRLTKLQGEEFDREYMKAMVEGHEEVADQLLRHAGWIGTSTRNGSTAATPSATGTSGTAGSGSTSDATATTGTVSNAAGADTSGGSADTNVKMWAMKTLPVVQQHLQRAREIRDKVDKAR